MSDQVSEAFRLAMRGMAATVSILTTRLEGVPYGMTATAIAPVSMAPPALLVSVNQNASIHAPIRKVGAYWVNVLGENHREQCSAFGGKLMGVDRFRCGSWLDVRGMPCLKDAQANLYCCVEREVPFATHTIFIARVVDVLASRGARPLIFLDGRPGQAAFHDTARGLR